MNLGRALDRLPASVAIPVRARYGDQDVEVRHLSRFVKPGDVVLDVGAHKGAYTWHLAKLVGAGGRVHAFEPQPDLAARLRRGLPDAVTVHQFALSDSNAVLPLSVPIWGSVRMQGHASLETSRPGQADEDQVEVATRVADDLGLRPTFIKVDIEGHELSMLRGSEKMIRACRPALLLEIDYRHAGEAARRRDLIAWIRDHDYVVKYVDGPALRGLEQLPAEEDPNDSTGLDRYVYNWFLIPR